MKIGVMSDTHGHLTEMRKTAMRMLEEFGVDVIIHLGDDSTDADELAGICDDVIAVPGVFEARYKDPSIQNRIVKKFDGITFLITHTPTHDAHDLPLDPDPTELAQDGEVGVVLHGHTHRYCMEEKNGALYINPGNLNVGDKRSDKMTFAILEPNKGRLNVKIVEFAGGVIENKNFFVGK